MSFPGDAGRDGSASGSDAARSSRPDHGFPRSHRLVARKQFLAVRDRGRRVASASFILQGIPNQLGRSRLGITVTRKVGNAVRRNRIKRMLREIFRYNHGVLASSVDLVVVARRGIEERPLVDLEREFLQRSKELLRRLAP